MLAVVGPAEGSLSREALLGPHNPLGHAGGDAGESYQQQEEQELVGYGRGPVG